MNPWVIEKVGRQRFVEAKSIMGCDSIPRKVYNQSGWYSDIDRTDWNGNTNAPEEGSAGTVWVICGSYAANRLKHWVIAVIFITI